MIVQISYEVHYSCIKRWVTKSMSLKGAEQNPKATAFRLSIFTQPPSKTSTSQLIFLCMDNVLYMQFATIYFTAPLKNKDTRSSSFYAWSYAIVHIMFQNLSTLQCLSSDGIQNKCTNSTPSNWYMYSKILTVTALSRNINLELVIHMNIDTGSKYLIEKLSNRKSCTGQYSCT